MASNISNSSELSIEDHPKILIPNIRDDTAINQVSTTHDNIPNINHVNSFNCTYGTSDFYSHDEECDTSSFEDSDTESWNRSTSLSSYSCCSLCSCSTCFIATDLSTSSFSEDSNSDITNVSPLPPLSLSPMIPGTPPQYPLGDSYCKDGSCMANIDMDSLLRALKKINRVVGVAPPQPKQTYTPQNGDVSHLIPPSPVSRLQTNNQQQHQHLLSFKVIKPCCKHSLPKHLVNFVSRDKFIRFVNSHYYTNSVLVKFNDKKCVHAKHNAKLFTKTAKKFASHRAPSHDDDPHGPSNVTGRRRRRPLPSIPDKAIGEDHLLPVEKSYLTSPMAIDGPSSSTIPNHSRNHTVGSGNRGRSPNVLLVKGVIRGSRKCTLLSTTAPTLGLRRNRRQRSNRCNRTIATATGSGDKNNYHGIGTNSLSR